MRKLLHAHIDNRIFPFVLLPIVVLMLAVALSGCTTAPVEPKEYPVTGWQYDAIAEAALKEYGKELLKAEPKDIREWCPNWANANRVKVYAALLAHMSKRESGHDPKREYKESFKNGKGETVVSVGLLQVSYESCRSYGVRGATTESLKSPAQNLECGVRILNKWVPQHLLIAETKDGKHFGGAKYWSVLRPGNSKEYIQKKMKELCR